jgi:hypothetical protein
LALLTLTLRPFAESIMTTARRVPERDAISSLAHVREALIKWKVDYNTVRPIVRSFANLPPATYAKGGVPLMHRFGSLQRPRCVTEPQRLKRHRNSRHRRMKEGVPRHDLRRECGHCNHYGLSSGLMNLIESIR